MIRFFTGILLWYHTHKQSHKHTQHTEGPVDWHTHINIYLHQLLCAHNSYLYYIEWIIHWYKKFSVHSLFFSKGLVSMKISDTLFYYTNPSYFIEKILMPFFLKSSKLTPPIPLTPRPCFIKGVPTMFTINISVRYWDISCWVKVF